MYIKNDKERCVTLALYLVENNATVRSVAKKFGISKSTVHKDITQHLRKIDMELYHRSKIVLDKNKKERHLRGGEATKRKYQKSYGLRDCGLPKNLLINKPDD